MPMRHYNFTWGRWGAQGADFSQGHRPPGPSLRTAPGQKVTYLSHFVGLSVCRRAELLKKVVD